MGLTVTMLHICHGNTISWNDSQFQVMEDIMDLSHGDVSAPTANSRLGARYAMIPHYFRPIHTPQHETLTEEVSETMRKWSLSVGIFLVEH